MKRILIAALAAVMMISAVTGFTVLNGRVKETMVPVAYAIPLHASVPLPSASSNLVSAAGSGLTSGAALCAGYLNDAGIPCRMADESHRMQSAVGVALCAEEMAARGETVTAQALEPVYLRLSQAERERLARGLKITLD